MCFYLSVYPHCRSMVTKFSWFWISQMGLDLIEAVDPKQALPGCYLERCVYVDIYMYVEL